MKTTVLKTFESATEAHLARIKLEDEGISCFIANENFSTLMPNYFGIMGSGVQLVVFENDAVKSRQILSKNDTSSISCCPNCDSSSVQFEMGKTGTTKWAFIILSLFTAVPMSNLKKVRVCADCKTEY